MAYLGLAVLMLCVSASAASAQTNRPNPNLPAEKYDLRPLVAPVIILPPNTSVTPGSSIRPYDSAPATGNSTVDPPPPGLTITIPSR